MCLFFNCVVYCVGFMYVEEFCACGRCVLNLSRVGCVSLERCVFCICLEICLLYL